MFHCMCEGMLGTLISSGAYLQMLRFAEVEAGITVMSPGWPSRPPIHPRSTVSSGG